MATGKRMSGSSCTRGFGVNIAYGGHDMHGLKIVPDGRLYWSIADRGFAPPENISGLGFSSVHLQRFLPDTGAIFRCNTDGSHLEVVAIGLRNPQELAFDAQGNLFTADNNADGGDKARWTHVVAGADYGWRYGWQHLPKLGAWNSEALWELEPLNSGRYILPPAGHVGHGPGGIAYYPGMGLPAGFEEHFFYADFPGGIRFFKVRPKGASFVVDNPEDYLQNNSAGRMAGKLLWDLYPTDIDFGPDGGAYVLDWVQGWEKTGKGRLWRVHDPVTDQSPTVLETKSILVAGFDGREADELSKLLGHVDQRVRMGAQEALVSMARDSVAKKNRLTRLIPTANKPLVALLETARTGRHPLGRVHAIRALGQLAQIATAEQQQQLVRLCLDREPDIRVAAARSLAQLRFAPALPELFRLMGDPELRVQLEAALAAAEFADSRIVPHALELLRNNADRDAFLRHAGVVALSSSDDPQAVLKAASDSSPAVRSGVLLTLRRWEMPEVASFLNEKDPLLVLEAARAINDLPIDGALPKLAAMSAEFGKGGAPAWAGGNTTPSDWNPVLRRVINASFRLGSAKSARSLATLTANSALTDTVRVEAFEALAEWETPSGRDKITGLWRPITPRAPEPARVALRAVVPTILKAGDSIPESVVLAAIGSVQKLDLIELSPALRDKVRDAEADADTRVAALRVLAVFKDGEMEGLLKLAAADANESLRREASKLRGQAGGSGAMLALTTTMEDGSIVEKQAALQTLAGLKSKEADSLVNKWLGRLLEGKTPSELALDILEAGQGRFSPSINEKLARREAGLDSSDPLAVYQETLTGGDAKAGREIFFERAEVGCLRCHKINGVGGEVGPELAGIGKVKSREYLLEAIIAPSAQIAPGFENLLVTLKNGATYAGMLKGETADELTLNSAEDGLLKLKKSEIQARQKGLSSMLPELGTILTKRELRDVIEYLATVR